MVKSTSRRTGPKKRPARPAPARKPASRRKARAPGKPSSATLGKASGKAKWVYRFGNGKAEGRAGMRDLLGGKGAGLAEMANLGLPVPPGFTITTAVCTQFYANNKRYPATPRAGRRRADRGRSHHRQGIRRRRQSAPGVGALGRARVHARHDGHGAQSRPQRQDGRGAGAQIGRPALRLRFLSPLHHDVFGRRARPRASPLRGNPRRPQGQERLHARHRSVGGRLDRARSSATRSGSKRSTASRSRRIRTSSCGGRSAPCSAPG